MIRYFFISFIVLLLLLLFLRLSIADHTSELPAFLKKDKIAAAHQTKINLHVESLFKPSVFDCENLKKDYAAIWAHLNHLFESNDVLSGKEYYTEDWFKQICANQSLARPPSLSRKDLQHSLHIRHWSSDGLVCALIDSNVVFRYQHRGVVSAEKYSLAVLLLYQGDHWRIDAIRVLNDRTINN